MKTPNKRLVAYQYTDSLLQKHCRLLFLLNLANIELL